MPRRNPSAMSWRRSASCRRPPPKCRTTSSTTCGAGRCRALYVPPLAIHPTRAALIIPQVEGLLFWGWLGGYKYEGGQVKCGELLTIEDLGEILHSMCDFATRTTLTSSSSCQPQGPRRVPPLARGVPAVTHLARRRAGTLGRSLQLNTHH